MDEYTPEKEQFTWRDEQTGTVYLVDSSNVLDNLSSELKALAKDPQHLFHWYCCKCHMGPMGLQDAQAQALLNSGEKCTGRVGSTGISCTHEKCKDCFVAEGTEDPDGNISWKGKVSVKFGQPEMNCLNLSEGRLFQHMSTRGGLRFRDWGEILEPETPNYPSTPGLTISAAGTPQSEQGITDEPPKTLQCLEELIKIRKSELNLRLPSIWHKRQEARLDYDGMGLKELENKFESVLKDPQDFLLVWQHAILPFLTEFVPKWCGPCYTIGIRRARIPKLRNINILTEEAWDGTLREVIRQHILDLLPLPFHDTTGFDFDSGSIERLASSIMSTESQLDSICGARNSYFYPEPTMGDSIGVEIDQGDDHSTSTLGPCVMVGDQSCWLLNLHPLEDAFKNMQQNSPLFLEHPSPDDQKICESSGHKFVGNTRSKSTLGVIATSGKSTRTRTSKNNYWEEAFTDPPEIIMDWALCATIMPTTNFLRDSSWSGNTRGQPVLTTRQPEGGAPIFSSGRTSGYQRGQIGMCPDLVSAKITGATEDTMEWFVEESYPFDNEAAFTESSIGVSGDSGAAIIDEEHNAFVGQLWGRNKYKRKERGPRVAYFTPAQDIFDDIKDQCALSEDPSLPQLNDGSKLPSLRPACDKCFDRQLAQHQAMLSSPGMDFEDMTPPEDELLTPENIRSPEVRKHTDIEFRHIGLTIPAQSAYKTRSEVEGYGTELYGSARELELGFDSDASIDLESNPNFCNELHKRTACGQPTTVEEKRQRLI